jgi:hypothetical protein
MPCELDPQIAGHIVLSAISGLNPSPGNKVLCTRRALHEAFLAVAQEAHEIGFLAGQKERYGELTRPDRPTRPAWMDIRLDNPADLAKHHIQIKPVVLKIAERRRLLLPGRPALDIRSTTQGLYYVGIRTARAIVAIVRQFESNAESYAERNEPPLNAPNSQ